MSSPVEYLILEIIMCLMKLLQEPLMMNLIFLLRIFQAVYTNCSHLNFSRPDYVCTNVVITVKYLKHLTPNDSKSVF